MDTFEIEIKSLLGSSEKADALRARMKEIDPKVKLLRSNAQLNHYFAGGDITKLAEAAQRHLTGEDAAKLERITLNAKQFSVRTREVDGRVLLVAKISIDDTTSDNGITRIEFEAPVNMTLGELDQLIISAGFTYQAKWSRKREEYELMGATICLDKNAGYGYLAEVEKVVSDASKAEEVRQELRSLMGELGLEELPQDRLERMFAYYNANWKDYYGTDKVFNIA